MKYLLSVIIPLLSFHNISAQSFGAHPTGLDWQIMKSPAGNIIFPKGMETKANRVVGIINYLNTNNRRSVGNRSKRINIVLQTQTVDPNGYVSLAPFMSEFYATPPESMGILGSMDWLETLAIHEYRHVQQIRNTKKGLTLLAYILTGQLGWSVLSAISIPNWYYEGDAVIMETALTEAGRGRSPFFTSEQRALALSNTNYSYSKARNGSYKDVVPNHYPLGYMMLTHLRNRKGNDIIQKVVSDASWYRTLLWPFSGGLKRRTGYRTSTLYHEAWNSSKKKWANDLAKIDLSSSEAITSSNTKTPTNYYLPQFDEKGKIFAIMDSYQKTPAIYGIGKNELNKIASPGIGIFNYFSYDKNKFVWTEKNIDIRRSNLSYSDIYTYNIKSNKKEKISKKGKYFSPVFSNDGKHIFAIEVNDLQHSSIHKINIKNEKLVSIISLGDDAFLSRLSVIDEDHILVNVKKNSKLHLAKINLITGKETIITKPTSHVIDNPRVHANYVYYSAGLSGIDNIYRSPLDGSQSTEQLTSVAIGAYDPAVNIGGDKLVFTQLSKTGRYISQVELNDNKKIGFRNEQRFKEPIEMQWLDSVAYKMEGGPILDKIPDSTYEYKKYLGILPGLQLHSWGYSTINSNTMLGVKLQNYLNDITVDLGFGSNNNELGNAFNTMIRFGRWYPQFGLNFGQSNRSTEHQLPNFDIEKRKFNQTDLGLNITLPFHWLKGNYINNLNLTSGFIRTHTNKIISDISGDLDGFDFKHLDNSINFSTIRRSAHQNIGPRAGFIVQVNHQMDLDVNDQQRLNTNGKFYLPGIGLNHSVKIDIGYQKELLNNNFQHLDEFVYARGFKLVPNDKSLRASINYGLPLLYPDWGFLGIIYLKRIRANVFYDFSRIKLNSVNQTTDLSSVGAELIFDNVMLNLLPISVGARVSFLLNEDPNNLGIKYLPEIFFAEQF